METTLTPYNEASEELKSVVNDLFNYMVENEEKDRKRIIKGIANTTGVGIGPNDLNELVGERLEKMINERENFPEGAYTIKEGLYRKKDDIIEYIHGKDAVSDYEKEIPNGAYVILKNGGIGYY